MPHTSGKLRAVIAHQKPRDEHLAAKFVAGQLDSKGRGDIDRLSTHGEHNHRATSCRTVATKMMKRKN